MGITCPPEFFTARDLQACCSASPVRLERHITDHRFPRPMEFGVFRAPMSGESTNGQGVS